MRGLITHGTLLTGIYKYCPWGSSAAPIHWAPPCKPKIIKSFSNEGVSNQPNFAFLIFLFISFLFSFESLSKSFSPNSIFENLSGCWTLVTFLLKSSFLFLKNIQEGSLPTWYQRCLSRSGFVFCLWVFWPEDMAASTASCTCLQGPCQSALMIVGMVDKIRVGTINKIFVILLSWLLKSLIRFLTLKSF